MGLTLQELLAMKVDLFSLEEFNDCSQIIVHCLGCTTDSIEFECSYGELTVSAANDEIKDSKSLFLGFDCDQDDIQVEKLSKQLLLTFPSED